MHWESKSQRRGSSWRCCSGTFESTLFKKQWLESATVELRRSMSCGAGDMWVRTGNCAAFRYQSVTPDRSGTDLRYLFCIVWV